MNHKLFGITGWKNSGKTTLTERLVQELTRRGYQISTVKHAHHNFDIDHVGKDSWRHRKAGAAEVAVVSSARYAIMHENLGEAEPSLEAIVGKLAPCDLVLIEGYKRRSHKKSNFGALTARRSTLPTTIPALLLSPAITSRNMKNCRCLILMPSKKLPTLLCN